MESNSLVDDLQKIAAATLGKHIEKHSPVVLLDYPNHTNVGDCAIWVGEISFLGGNNNSIRYVCDIASYDPDKLKRFSSGATILIHGGGNFGDVWVRHLNFKERVLADFKSNKIIQLPVSVHYKCVNRINTTVNKINEHGNFILYVRDRESYKIAIENFNCKVELCPDSAFCIGKIKRPNVATCDNLCLLRTDIEKHISSLKLNENSIVCDWVDEGESLTRLSLAFYHRILHHIKTETAFHQYILLKLYNRLANDRLKRGCRILSKGKKITTDRLHAHILSLLMGIHHDIYDNNNGKIRHFYDTWTIPSHLVKLIV